MYGTLITLIGWLLAAVTLVGAVARAQYGPGVTPPKLLRKVEPKYTDEARASFAQGAVIVDLVIDTDGKAKDMSVISPLGFGLDDAAIEAVKQWEFQPAEKDGKPVKMMATVEVNFRMMEGWAGEKTVQRRAFFAAANRALQDRDPDAVRKATAQIEQLSKEKYPPAMFLHAMMIREGKLNASKPDQVTKLLQFAAGKRYGPAMYEVGKMHLDGKDVPKDEQLGLRMMRESAELGGTGAQFYLGQLYEAGNGVEKDLDKAQRYYLLCAASGQELCQIRLGKLLMTRHSILARGYLRGIAWLAVAAEAGSKPAQELLEKELPKLSNEQKAAAWSLKAQMGQKR